MARSATGLFSVSKQFTKGSLLWAEQLEKAHTPLKCGQLYRYRMWWAEDTLVQRERCHLLWVGRYSAHQNSWHGGVHRVHLPRSHVAVGSTHIQGVCCPVDPISMTASGNKNQKNSKTIQQYIYLGYLQVQNRALHLFMAPMDVKVIWQLTLIIPTETLRESKSCTVCLVLEAVALSRQAVGGRGVIYIFA